MDKGNFKRGSWRSWQPRWLNQWKHNPSFPQKPKQSSRHPNLCSKQLKLNPKTWSLQQSSPHRPHPSPRLHLQSSTPPTPESSTPPPDQQPQAAQVPAHQPTLPRPKTSTPLPEQQLQAGKVQAGQPTRSHRQLRFKQGNPHCPRPRPRLQLHSSSRRQHRFKQGNPHCPCPRPGLRSSHPKQGTGSSSSIPQSMQEHRCSRLGS